MKSLSLESLDKRYRTLLNGTHANVNTCMAQESLSHGCRLQKQQATMESKLGMLRASTARRQAQAMGAAGRQALPTRRLQPLSHPPARGAAGGWRARGQPTATQATEVRELQAAAAGAAAARQPPGGCAGPVGVARVDDLAPARGAASAGLGLGEEDRRVRSPVSKRLGRMSDAGLCGGGKAAPDLEQPDDGEPPGSAQHDHAEAAHDPYRSTSLPVHGCPHAYGAAFETLRGRLQIISN